MQAPPPPPYQQALPPLGAPPGGIRDPRSPAARYATLGTTSLVLAACQLVLGLQRVVTTSMSGSMMQLQRGMMPALMPKGSPLPMGKVLDAAQEFASRIAIWELLRALPFMAASATLAWIGVRLRRGDATALAAARRWVAGAFVVIGVSVIIQGLVTIPATIEYSKAVTDIIPTMPTGAGAPPFDVKAMTGQLTVAITIASAIFGTLVLSVWPIVLYVWSGKLARETLPARAG